MPDVVCVVSVVRKVGEETYVSEYNVRMGDPETQVVWPRVKNDLGELLLATAEGRLSQIEIEIDDRSYTTIVAVSGGYPEGYPKGKEITGLEKVKGCNVFHAGTTVREKKTFTIGGRVLAVTSFGEGHKSALKQSYEQIQKINFDGMYFRGDIGIDLYKGMGRGRNVIRKGFVKLSHRIDKVDAIN